MGYYSDKRIPFCYVHHRERCAVRFLDGSLYNITLLYRGSAFGLLLSESCSSYGFTRIA